MEWISLKDQLPPDEGRVKIKDEHGNEAFAIPAYCSFRLEDEPVIRWGQRVVDCEPYFDGWLIEAESLTTKISGAITHWKPLP